MDPDGPWSAFEPIGVPEVQGPKATVDPRADRRWMRRLWPMLRPYRFVFGTALAGALVAMIAGVLVPRVTMGAIDSALVARTQPLAPYLWLLAALAVVRAVITFSYRRTLFRVAYDLEFDLRTLVYGHLTRLDFPFYDRVQSGQLISRANSDIRSVQMFTTFAPLLSLNLVSFVVAVVIMLSIDVPLTLIALCTLPFTYLAGLRLRNVVFPMSWIVQARQADLATVVDESVQGVRVVKGFAAEERQVEKVAASSGRLRWANVLLNDARARWGPLVENLPRLGLAGVLLYGGMQAIDGEIGIGVIVAFNSYVLLVQAPFRFLSTILMLGQRAAASAQRIYELLDEHPTVAERPGAVDLERCEGRVELRDVRFGHAGRQAVLDGCSLDVRAGETVALVGRTGSGKSTVARLLPRFYDVDAGAVLVDGHDVRDLSLGSLRHNVRVLLDDAFLFSDTVSANVAYGRPAASDADVWQALADAGARRFVGDLPATLGTTIGERGYDLSGGQRQRLALARALLDDPAVLVLDDATSAVDVQVEAAIHEALRHRRKGRTTIVIAQRLSTIALADRVVLLEGGSVVAEGTHAELLASEPRYAEVLARAAEEDENLADVAALETDLLADDAVNGNGDRIGPGHHPAGFEEPVR